MNPRRHIPKVWNHLLRRLLVITLFLLAISTAHADLLIKNVTLVTGNSEQNSVEAKGGYLWIVSGKIHYVGSQAPKVPATTPELDGEGGFLLPGLIDSHVHLGMVPGIHIRDLAQKNRLVDAWRAWEASAYLQHGFTSLVDLGEFDRDYVAKYYPMGSAPRVFGVGRTVRQLDGYGHNFFSTQDAYRALPNFLINRAQKAPEAVELRDHEPARLVANAKQEGAIAIKTFYEDGFSGVFPNLALPEVDQLKELKKAAAAEQLPVVLHATSIKGYQVAADVGVDVIAHGLWHRATGDFSQPMSPESTKQLFEQLADRAIAVQPTLRVVLAEVESDRPYSQQSLVSLPSELCRFYLSPAAQTHLEEGEELVTLLRQRGYITSEQSLSSLRSLFAERATTQIKAMHDAGIQFLFGTDTPTPTGAAVAIPGRNAYLEMQAWTKAGIPLKQLFLALTDRNARKFKLNNVGRLEKGYLADLVLLRKNPLQDVSAYEKLQQVWIAGKPMLPDQTVKFIKNEPYETCAASF